MENVTFIYIQIHVSNFSRQKSREKSNLCLSRQPKMRHVEKKITKDIATVVAQEKHEKLMKVKKEEKQMTLYACKKGDTTTRFLSVCTNENELKMVQLSGKFTPKICKT